MTMWCDHQGFFSFSTLNSLLNAVHDTGLVTHENKPGPSYLKARYQSTRLYSEPIPNTPSAEIRSDGDRSSNGSASRRVPASHEAISSTSGAYCPQAGQHQNRDHQTHAGCICTLRQNLVAMTTRRTSVASQADVCSD